MKKFAQFSVLLLILSVLFSCGNPAGSDSSNGDQNQDTDQDKDKDQDKDQDKDKNPDTSGIIWTDDSNGTLTVINSTSKDMVIFQGQTPSPSAILGGVKGAKTRVFNISDKVDDFNVGGYIVLRGITLDEYEASKDNLSKAKIEYSAMATYGQGKKFRTEISPNYMGEYGYKVTNSGKIGMELRKDSPEGEKIGYLPSLATNVLLYSENTDGLAIFPVYVYYTKSTGTITTVKPSSHFESVTAAPRPLNSNEMQTYQFPSNSDMSWDTIKASLISPMAYISVTNNVTNQAAYFTMAGSNRIKAQNGYDSMGSGEQLTFELESKTEGAEKNIVITLYNGQIKVPVRFEGATDNPTIKNGYDYSVSLKFNGGKVDDSASYTAVLKEGAKRDISNDIESL